MRRRGGYSIMNGGLIILTLNCHGDLPRADFYPGPNLAWLVSRRLALSAPGLFRLIFVPIRQDRVGPEVHLPGRLLDPCRRFIFVDPFGYTATARGKSCRDQETGASPGKGDSNHLPRKREAAGSVKDQAPGGAEEFLRPIIFIC